MPVSEGEVQDLRFQALATATIKERGVVLIAGQLLSGDLDAGSAVVLQSEEQDDRWKVKRAQFFGTGSGEGEAQALREGRRVLWFTPLKELRPIKEGEIFTQALEEVAA